MSLLQLLALLAVAGPPARKQVLPLVRAANPGATVVVSNVLAGDAPGQFVVLFVKKERDCYTRDEVPGKPKECSPTSLPHVALGARDAGALGLRGGVALPTRAAPWDVAGELQWGIAQQGDRDQDGKRELLVVYAYDGPSLPAVGSTRYKDLALIATDPPALALHVGLEESPQASVHDRVRAKFKFTAGKPELVLSRTVSSPGEPGEREEVDEVVTYRVDAAKHEWRIAETKRGKPRKVSED